MAEQFQVVKPRKRKPLLSKCISAVIKAVNRVLVPAKGFVSKADPCAVGCYSRLINLKILSWQLLP